MKTRAQSLLPPLLLLALCLSARKPPRGEEGFVKTPDGVNLYYRVIGEGKETLVVVHGGPGNSLESIYADLEPLAKNRRVIYYDQRGNGRSDLTTDPEKLEVSHHIEDLEVIRKRFGLEKMTLMGNSWGGLLVGYYAVTHPDRVDRMILHSPAEPAMVFMRKFTEDLNRKLDPARRERFQSVSNPQSWRKAKDPRATCREFFEILLPLYFAQPSRAKQMRGDVCSGSEEAVRNQQLVNSLIWRSLGEWDLRKDLAKVTAPMLVIHGRQDLIPLESSQAWARSAKDGRLLVVEDSGHLPHVEHPEIFFPDVEEFLSGKWPKEARMARAEDK